MSCWAIIPARGGSKSIPRKNIKPLAGKPLIGWNIEAAKACASIDRVIVSTDDAEIAAISRQFGVEVVERPAEISGDTSSSEAALLHTLESEAARGQDLPELLAFLQCTSPLTAAEDIEGTITALRQDGADSAFAATVFHYFLWKQQEDGAATGVNHVATKRLMRQEREPEFLETGAVYVMKVAGFLQARHRFFGRIALHTMPVSRVLEIDEPEDWLLAETRMQDALRRRRKVSDLGKFRTIVFDFDGVMTDDTVHVGQDGMETVTCSRADGQGIEMLRKAGFRLLILSKEVNPVVAARAQKLKLEHYHGIADKLPLLQQWAHENGVPLEEIAYMGNDINDVECMRAAGWSIAPADAHESALAAAQYVTSAQGGRGAVREVADLLLSQN